MTPTKLTAALVAITLLVSSPAGSATALSVLFIGNSFTFAAGSPVRYYRADTVTDLNGEGIGGVPALFESFTRQAGLDYEVSLETRGGSGLDFHLAEKADVIGRRGWDTVVMHGYSTLDSAKPRDPAKLIATSARMAALLREKNPKVAIYLMATWSRADQIYPAAGAWAGTAVDVMARDVRAAYDTAAREAAATAVIPVGEAWNSRHPDRRRGRQSVRRHRRRQARSLDLRPLPRQHLRVVPGGAGHLRRRHRPRSALARRRRVLGVRAGAVTAAGRRAPAGGVRSARGRRRLRRGASGGEGRRAGALRRRTLAVAERRHGRRRGAGVRRRLERHRLVVVEELGADAVERRRRCAARRIWCRNGAGTPSPRKLTNFFIRSHCTFSGLSKEACESHSARM